MKSRIVVLCLFLSVVATKANASRTGFGVECTINGLPAQFERIHPTQGATPGIVDAQARISDNLSLRLHYNIFYDIGGTLRLMQDEAQLVRVLRWNTPHEAEILASTIRHHGNTIRCESRETN